MASASGVARTLKIFGVTLLVGAGIVAWLALQDGDDSTAVPGPTAADRQATAQQLAKATSEQKVCYGWQLTGGTGGVVSQGSNLGGEVPVDSNPGRCPKWVQVHAVVYYTSTSSEADDTASVTVISSPNVRLDAGVEPGLARFGITDRAFVDDPGRAICAAALALPLLVAEAGGAEPARASASAPATAPPALASPGSDFWRDRWIFLLSAGAVAFVALLLLVIGIFERRAHREATARPYRSRSGRVPVA